MTLPSVTNSEARAQTTLVVPNASGGEPSAGRFDVFLVAVASAALSIISLVYYFRHGELLLYGDAVAHINIARRIFDSLTPGFGQLGTVWLPLPHLLIAPFIVNHAMWRSGIGAAIPSMMAYVLGAVGIYRLTRRTLKNAQATESVARLGGFLAAALFAANPSLIYLQTTAMNEPLYLALFVWALVWLQEFWLRAGAQRQNAENPARGPLLRSGLLLCGAELTRYEGWVVAALCAVIVVGIFAARRQLRAQKRSLIAFLLMVVAAPLFWLGYNKILFGNALEFATGPYSAYAIEHRGAGGGPLHPGDHDLKVATSYYAQAVLGDLGETWRRRHLLWLAVAGVALLLATRRGSLLLLLWAPLPFYVYSVAYGSIPIFVPNLSPWSYYNARYGTALLPAIAVFTAICVALLVAWAPWRWMKVAVVGLAVAIAGTVYASAYLEPQRFRAYAPGEPRRGPLVWREAVVNSVSRIAFEQELARELQKLPGDSRLLMYAAAHVGALQTVGIPLRHVITEANHDWWERARANPGMSADFIIAIEDDSVAQAVEGNPLGLQLMVEIRSPGQPLARIYRSLLSRHASH